MTTLTEKESAMITAFIREGCDRTWELTVEGLLEDNMTYMSASDLCRSLGWDKQTVGGVMSALSEKRLIVDSYESARGTRDTDWYATDDAIREFFHLR